MDPLTIATTVVALTATCLGTCRKLSDLASSYSDVPAIIAVLCSESTVISCALSQLQALILQRDDLAQAWASDNEVLQAFEMSLNGCMVVFSCLEAEARRLQTQLPGSTGGKVWSKIKFMWNQDRLKELLSALRGQQTSINFLLQVLECKTLSDIQKSVEANKTRILASVSDAKSMMSKTSSVKMTCQSVLDNDTHRLTLFADDLASVAGAPSELEFEFDDFVLNSQAYRRAFAKATMQNFQRGLVQVVSGDLIDLSEEVGVNAGVTTVNDIEEGLIGLDLSRHDSHTSTDGDRALQKTGKSFAKNPRKPLRSPSKDFESTKSRDISKARDDILENKVNGTDHTPGHDLGKTSLKEYGTIISTKAPLVAIFCKECDAKSGGESHDFKEGSQACCFFKVCCMSATRCAGCRWPIANRSIHQADGALAGDWHPDCYQLRKRLNVTILPTWDIQRILESFERGRGNCITTKACHDKVGVMIHNTWAWSSMFLEALTEHSAAVQNAFVARDLKSAFTHWNALTALIHSLLQAIHKCSLGGFLGIDERSWGDLLFLDAKFDPMEQRSASNLAREMSLLKPIPTTARSILQRVLIWLLSDDGWHGQDSRLDLFLCRLTNTLMEKPWPRFMDRAPVMEDFKRLQNCATCYGSTGNREVLITTRQEKKPGNHHWWHQECWTCPRCRHYTTERLIHSLPQGGRIMRIPCMTCKNVSTVQAITRHELLTEAMWASWVVIKGEKEKETVDQT